MAISTYFDKDMLMLVIGIGTQKGHRTLVQDLDAALAKVEATLDDDSIYFRAIDLTGTWKKQDGEFDPWSEANMLEWTKVATSSDLRPVLKDWLGKTEKLLARHKARTFGTIWESEETQLGEVPATVCALADINFVPTYTSLLGQWDLDHRVMQEATVENICQRHGDNPYTSALASAWAPWA
jgi:hypothetical protein